MTVLGQSFRVVTEQPLAVSDFVRIEGRLSSAGDFVPMRLFVLPDAYVPGASQVLLTGKVTAVDAARGLAKVGRQWVDYTPLLGLSNVQLSVGQRVFLVGTQPAPEGVVLVSGVVVHR